MDAATFDRMTRDELVAKARALGVERAELMTRVELKDEIVRRQEPDPIAQRRARGWLGVARDLVAGVVESGLNLPDAAALIRGRGDIEHQGPSPVATVTLAQIYAAQGHHARAIAVLDEVLAKEPDHAAARALRERFTQASDTRSDVAAKRGVLDVEGSSAEESPVPRTVIAPEAPPPPASVEPGAAAPEPASAPDPVAPEPASVPAPEPAARVGAIPARRPSVVITRTADAPPEVLWELGDLARAPETRLTLRFIAWTVSSAGLSEHAGELPLNERRGRARLPGVEAQAVVRAALGYRKEEAFVPLVIASEIVSANGALRVAFRAPPGSSQEVQPEERELVLALTGLN